MFDPDNPKLQDKGRGNSIHFERAYWLAMEQVEAPAESINALLPLLYDSWEAGLPVKQLRYLAQYLPDDQWCWPEYDRQIAEGQKREYEEEKTEMAAAEDLETVVRCDGFPALRKVAQELLAIKIPAIKEIQQAEALCIEIQNNGHGEKLLKMLKPVALEKLEKQFNNEMSPENMQREMRETLVHRIFRLASGFWKCQRINSVIKSFPYLMLSVSDPSRAKPECIENDNKPYRLDSEFWKRGMPPCELINCTCHVIQMNERMVQQHSLKIVDKE